MSRTHRLVIATSATLLAVGSARASQASVLLLDYGPTTVSGASLTNSPGFASGAWTNATPTWNSASILDGTPVPDVTSGLSYIDGSSASGVKLDLAAAAGTGNTTNGGTQPTSLMFGDSITAHQPTSSNALGTTAGSGVYAGNSVGKDGIFEGGTGSLSAMGLNITGLTPGTYNIFLTGRNTNGQGLVGFPDNFWVDATNIAAPTGTAVSYTIPSVADPGFQVVSNPSGSPTTWTAGVDYIEATVTLTSSSPSLTIITEGQSNAGANEGRGFLNSVEVVSAPEPTSIGIFALASGGLLIRRRRHG